MKYAVLGNYCGAFAIWGLYEDEVTAKRVAEKVNGKVAIWE